MRAQINTRDYEQISAYIDGQLGPAEQRKLEERLRRQPELQDVLDDLTRTRALLRQAPRRRAPRNFTLTPAMVGDYRPRSARRGGWTLFPALSFASALATLALVASLLFQLMPGALNPAQPDTTSMAQPEAADTAPMEKRQAQPLEEPAQALEAPQAAEDAGAAPPVINWGGLADAAPMEGRGGGGGMVGNEGIFAAPGCPNGPCGGGAPDIAFGMGGGGDGSMGGGISLPPGSVESAPAAGIMAAPEGESAPQREAAPQEESAPQQDAAPQGEVAPTPDAAPQEEAPAEKSGDAQDSTITGTGPILGVPEPETGGEIFDQVYLQGMPEGGVDEFQSAEAAENQPGLFGLPQLLGIQILLALIALVTGAAAFLLWRRAR